MENVREISYLVENICLGLAGAAAVSSLIIAYSFKPAQKEREEISTERPLEKALREYSKKE